MTCDLQTTDAPAFPVTPERFIPSEQKALLAYSLDGEERMTFDGVWFNIERKSPCGPVGAWQVKYKFGSRPEAEEEMMADGGPKPSHRFRTGSD